MNIEKLLRNPKKPIILILSLLVLTVLFFKSTLTIDSGEAGVVYDPFNGGTQTESGALGEGFHLIYPWKKVIIYDIRQKNIFETMKVLSSSGLEITLETSNWVSPDYRTLGKLHKEKGKNYLEDIATPSLRKAARSVVSKYSPEEIYSSKRDQIGPEIFEEARKLLSSQYLKVNNVLVRDIDLPKGLQEAIERKLKREQESLEYDYKITKSQKEAERQRIEAKGKADANRILSASLTDKILQDKGIEATNKLSESPNSKVVIIGSGKTGMPLILGNQ